MMFRKKVHASGTKVTGWATGLGILAIGLLVGLGISSPRAGCGLGDAPPVMAFQAASSETDLISIFGLQPSACDAVVEALEFGSRADLFVFIPVYAAFLILVGLCLTLRTTKIRLALFAALAATVAGDIAETSAQLKILDDVSAGSEFLGILMVGNGAKTLGLSVFLAGAAALLWQEQTWTSCITAILLGALAAARISGYLIDDVQPLAPLSALGAFVVLWVFVAFQFIKFRSAPAGAT